MGTNYYAVRNRPSIEDPIHIGKSSWGWKFLFQFQNETWHDPPVVWNTYDQVKEWLQKYVVNLKDYVIMDEYDRVVDYDDFLSLVEEKQKVSNPDDFHYARNVNGYRFTEGDFS